MSQVNETSGIHVHDNSGQRWSDEEIMMVRQLLGEQVAPADIADVLGRTPEAIHYMSTRLKYEGTAHLRCARCSQVQPAAHFRPSQRFDGGYCTSCARAYERGTEQIETLAVE